MSTDATETRQDHAAEADHAGGGHASAAFYVWIGLILAIVTGVEVAIFYIEALSRVEVPLLMVLSTSKVVLVVMYFMHLKLEPRFLTGVFIAGVVLATLMVSALVVLYHFLPVFG